MTSVNESNENNCFRGIEKSLISQSYAKWISDSCRMIQAGASDIIYAVSQESFVDVEDSLQDIQTEIRSIRELLKDQRGRSQ